MVWSVVVTTKRHSSRAARNTSVYTFDESASGSSICLIESHAMYGTPGRSMTTTQIVIHHPYKRRANTTVRILQDQSASKLCSDHRGQNWDVIVKLAIDDFSALSGHMLKSDYNAGLDIYIATYSIIWSFSSENVRFTSASAIATCWAVCDQ